MNGLRDMLQQEAERLENIIKETEASLKHTPEGYLRISKDKGRTRFYHCVTDRTGTYISKKDDTLPKQLAQKDYDSKVLKNAQMRYKQITNLLKDYSDDEIEQIYENLKDERRRLIKPIELPMDQMEESWYRQSYAGKAFLEGTAEIWSEKGERVRSKSEKIIADWLYRNHVKYLYEKPLHLKGYGIVYPDFSFFSKKTGREIYWEHEGMMDNPEYAQAAVRKIEMYEKNGIFPGENLILTFETTTKLVNTEEIKRMAAKYLS